MTDTTFSFDGKLYIGPGVYIDLDTEYVSRGTQEPATIRVRGVCRDRVTLATDPDHYDIEVGEAFYEALIAQAEAWGAKCVECDREADAQRYEGDRREARAARHAAE